MKANIPIGIPIICSLVSFILAMLVIFAGKDPGFMEDYHIIMVQPLLPAVLSRRHVS